MKAFHSDESIRADHIEHARTAGSGLLDCAAGRLNISALSDSALFLGIPHIVAVLEECIFQRLPDSSTWRADVLSAIPQGADLSGVWGKLARWMLTDAMHGVARLLDYEKCWILKVDELLQQPVSEMDGFLYWKASDPLSKEIPHRWAGQHYALRTAHAVCVITPQVSRMTFHFAPVVREAVACWIEANSGWVRGYWVEERVAVDALAKKFLEVLSEAH